MGISRLKIADDILSSIMSAIICFEHGGPTPTDVCHICKEDWNDIVNILSYPELEVPVEDGEGE